MPRDLTDHVIIITGASSGIGAATAIACAKAGMDVVINARRAEKLQALADQIKALGRNAEVAPGDVMEPGISQRLLDAAMQRFGRFDTVFANAGFGVHLPMTQTSDAMLREIFDVNFFAGADLLRQSAARLIEAKRPGHLLMCSSCIARFTIPLHGAYCATKAAQNHICRAMNIELGPHNIHVSSVHPVSTRTEFFDVSARRSGDSPASLRMIDETPRMFMQSAERVANAIVRCLRKPKPEVWTSHIVRCAAGMMTVWPGLGDFIMRRTARRLADDR